MRPRLKFFCKNNLDLLRFVIYPFKSFMPRRFPASYSLLVSRIPRDWSLDDLKSLLVHRYTSIIHLTRIFRDNQPTTRIRIDFHSQHEIQSILQHGYIYFDNIRYSVAPYKPLLPIDRCYKCQKFGHRIHDCPNESKCYKCGETHPYNPNCANPVKCANCTNSHSAGSPECPAKISYRRQILQQQRQQQQPNSSPTSQARHQFSTSPTFPSPARLYSQVLQTVSSNINSFPPTDNNTSPPPTTQYDHSSLIINTITDAIDKTQTVPLDRLIQLEQKSAAIAQQQLTSQQMLETQIIPHLMILSNLLLTISDTIDDSTPLVLNPQQKSDLTNLRELSHHYSTTFNRCFSSPSSTQFQPLLNHSQANLNLCSSLTTITNSPSSSIPSDSNILRNLTNISTNQQP